MDVVSKLPTAADLPLRPLLQALMSYLGPVAGQRIRTERGREGTDYVLSALDQADVAARLDALSGDVDFWASEATWKPVPWRKAEAELAEHKVNEQALDLVLGPPAAKRFLDGITALKRVFGDANRALEAIPRHINELARILAGQVGRPFKPPTPPPPKSFGELAEFLYDTSSPRMAREVVAAALRWVAVILVVGRAEDLGRRLEPWLALELGECAARFPEKTEAWIGTLNLVSASFPVLLVGKEAALRVEAALEAWSQQAGAEGIYFPDGGPADEGP
jgi:hypothetical protein